MGGWNFSCFFFFLILVPDMGCQLLILTSKRLFFSNDYMLSLSTHKRMGNTKILIKKKKRRCIILNKGLSFPREGSLHQCPGSFHGSVSPSSHASSGDIGGEFIIATATFWFPVEGLMSVRAKYLFSVPSLAGPLLCSRVSLRRWPRWSHGALSAA